MNAPLHQENDRGEKDAVEANDLLSALDQLQPGEHQQKGVLFAKAYPGILRAITRRVPQKEILDALSRNGLKLHPVRYREMLEAERRRRDEEGDLPCCDACGQALQVASNSKVFPAGNDLADDTMASQLVHSLQGATA